MRLGFDQNWGNWEQLVTTVVIGYLAALVPNRLSNIPPLVLAVLVGALSSKVIYGDWDRGYAWTWSDAVFWAVSAVEALLGGLIALAVRQNKVMQGY